MGILNIIMHAPVGSGGAIATLQVLFIWLQLAKLQPNSEVAHLHDVALELVVSVQVVEGGVPGLDVFW